MYLHRMIAAGLCAALAVPWAGAAEPEPSVCEAAPAAAARSATVDHEAEDEADSFGAPEQAPTLEQARGGDGGIASDTRLAGTVTNNSANHVVTGSNIIQEGSFANASGVPIVIQNTGANVLIQNATVINLQMK